MGRRQLPTVALVTRTARVLLQDQLLLLVNAGKCRRVSNDVSYSHHVHFINAITMLRAFTTSTSDSAPASLSRGVESRGEKQRPLPAWGAGAVAEDGPLSRVLSASAGSTNCGMSMASVVRRDRSRANMRISKQQAKLGDWLRDLFGAWLAVQSLCLNHYEGHRVHTLSRVRATSL